MPRDIDVDPEEVRRFAHKISDMQMSLLRTSSIISSTNVGQEWSDDNRKNFDAVMLDINNSINTALRLLDDILCELHDIADKADNIVF